VAGTFNNWNPEATRLVFIGGKKWFKDLTLAPGRYEYRFVVDGGWVDDPKAKVQVPNPHGGHNAVLEVPAGAVSFEAGLRTGRAPGGGEPLGWLKRE